MLPEGFSGTTGSLLRQPRFPPRKPGLSCGAIAGCSIALAKRGRGRQQRWAASRPVARTRSLLQANGTAHAPPRSTAEAEAVKAAAALAASNAISPQATTAASCHFAMRTPQGSDGRGARCLTLSS